MLFNYPLRPKTEADNTLQDLPNFFFTMQKPNPVIAKRLSVALCFFFYQLGYYVIARSRMRCMMGNFLPRAFFLDEYNKLK